MKVILISNCVLYFETPGIYSMINYNQASDKIESQFYRTESLSSLKLDNGCRKGRILHPLELDGPSLRSFSNLDGW